MHDFDLETKALGQVHCGSMNDKMSSKLAETLMMADVDGFCTAIRTLNRLEAMKRILSPTHR